MMNEQAHQVDTAIVGGGLGGLAAASYLARDGRAVTVLERSTTLGGRGATRERQGYRLNLGPHALYRGGEGMKVLTELGIPIRGGVPSVSGGYAIARGAKHAFPGGFVSLLTTGLFGVGAKLETARFLGTIPRIDASALERVSVRSFLERRIHNPEVRSFVAASFRVATYAHCPERMSAAVAVSQVKLALAKNVLYLDGGWQTIVDGLRATAEGAGATIRTGSAVESLSPSEGGWRVRLRTGEVLGAGSVIVALPLEAAAALLGDHAPALRQWAAETPPVRAACLDVGLSRLPDPRARFALGIDQPLYFSVHSAVASLAPQNAAVIHVAKYLHPDAPADPRGTELELEGVLDLLQPGWRKLVVERRFLPSMVAASALPLASHGGLGGRPGPQIPERPGLYVVGDWVGPQGFLADGSLASARAAAALAARECRSRAAA